LKNALKKCIAKDKSKTKRYLARVFEKIRNTVQSNLTDSPDPLNEHSNSVQDNFHKQDTISSLSEINSTMKGKSNL
jgi:hypothetical protein